MVSSSRSFIAMAALVFGLSVSAASADTVDTQVSQFVEARGPNDTAIALLAAYGRALRLVPAETDAQHLTMLREAARTGQGLRIEFTDRGGYDTIESIALSDAAEPLYDPAARLKAAPGPLPDLSGSPGKALRIFEGALGATPGVGRLEIESPEGPLSMVEDPSSLFGFFRSKRLLRGSQCFQRAMVWTHDMWKEKRIPSNKVFLFFTPKYVRSYGYKWWFHVSPYVITDGKEVTLDATFTSRPMEMKEWTDVFMGPDPHCPTIDRYYGWYNHHQDKYCYLRKVPMFYYHPDYIQISDRADKIITEWDLSEVRRAQVSRPY